MATHDGGHVCCRLSERQTNYRGTVTMTAPTPAAVERVARIVRQDIDVQRVAISLFNSADMEWIQQRAMEKLIAAALAAYHAQLDAEGMVIVPREPTGKMQDAAARLAHCKKCDGGFGDDVHQYDIWRAMTGAYEPPDGSE